MYYLQSRYYDPETGRFINADGLVDTGQSIHSQNMFAYCENDPVNKVDPSGKYDNSYYDSRYWPSRAAYDAYIYCKTRSNPPLPKTPAPKPPVKPSTPTPPSKPSTPKPSTPAKPKDKSTNGTNNIYAPNGGTVDNRIYIAPKDMKEFITAKELEIMDDNFKLTLLIYAFGDTPLSAIATFTSEIRNKNVADLERMQAIAENGSGLMYSSLGFIEWDANNDYGAGCYPYMANWE